MQFTDTKSLGIAPKTIIGSAGSSVTYTASSKHGCFVYVLNNLVTSALILKYDRINPDTDYGALTLVAGQWLPGVKTITLASGNALIIDPK